jgi:anti-sigma factor RsiW
MDEARDRELLRHLAGRLAPAEEAALARRLAADPALVARLATLTATWRALAPAPAAAAPPAFAARVRARAAAERASDGPTSWRLAPLWARATAAAALVAGVALGAALGLPAAGPAPVGGAGAELALPAAGTTLAESYWQLLDDAEADGEGVASP